MKKKFLATAVLAAAMAIAGPAYAADDIAVTVNGNPLTFDVAPQIVDGRTMVPMRAIFEEFGMVVDWDGSDRTIFARNGETSIRMQIDNKMSTKNGMQVENDVAPMVLDGRTMVPLRFIATALDMNPNWNGKTRTVEIVTEDDSYKEYRAWYEADKKGNLYIRTNVPANGLYAISIDGKDEYTGNSNYAYYQFCGRFSNLEGNRYVYPKAELEIFFNTRATPSDDRTRYEVKGEPNVQLTLNQPLVVERKGSPMHIESLKVDTTKEQAVYTFKTVEAPSDFGFYCCYLDYQGGSSLRVEGNLLKAIRRDIFHMDGSGIFYVTHGYGEVDANGNATLYYTPNGEGYPYKN